MREYGVRVCSKPLEWFVKGGRFNKQQIVQSLIESDTQEKTEHEWQQAVSAAERVIKWLTTPGDLVLDPMCGSGTTLVAARNRGRRWLGIEIKPETAALARERLASSPTDTACPRSPAGNEERHGRSDVIPFVPPHEEEWSFAQKLHNLQE